MGKTAYGAGAFALILLGALAAAASPIPSGPLVPFVTVAKGTTSDVHTPIRLTIHDPESWSRLWMQIMPPGRRPPTVDFARDMVIALSPGPAPEPALLTITRITRVPGRLVVSYTLTQTRPLSEGGGIGMSAPFHVVKLARSPLPVEFVLLKRPPILRRLP